MANDCVIICEEIMPFIKIPNRHCNSIYFAILFPLGSIDDPNGKAGIAHLTEHMMFRKAGTLTQKDIYDKSESLGIKINAKTGKTFTYFKFACRKDVFDEAINLLSDMLKETHYTDKDLHREKAVVSAEILQTESTNMQVIFDSRWQESAFENPILGTGKSIEAISLQDVVEYKARLLNSDFSIVLVGNFNDTTVKCVTNLFPQKNFAANAEKSLRETNLPARQNVLQFVHDKSEVIDVYYSYYAADSFPDDVLCLFVLDNVLFRGDKAFVTEHLRENLGCVYEVESYFAKFSNQLNWIFKLTVHKNNLTKTLLNLEKLLHDFVLSERYFQYVKAFCCDNLPMLCDDLDYLCTSTLWNYTNLNLWLTPEEFAQRISQLNLKQCDEFLHRINQDKKVYIFGKIHRKLQQEIASIVKG